MALRVRLPLVLWGAAVLPGCFTADPTPAGTDSATDGSTGEQTASLSATSNTVTTGPTTMGATSNTSAETDTPTSTTTSSSTTESTTTTPTMTGPDDSSSSTNGDPVCGDGERQGEEECDDGDVESGDGCSAACLDESDFCDPGLVGALPTPDMRRMAFANDHVYGFRTITPSELRYIDVSDPTNPIAGGQIALDPDNNPNWAPGDMIATATHLWTGGDNPEFMSIDISSPGDPMFDFFGGPNISNGGVEILGDLLYQAFSVGEQLRGWDISNPDMPVSLPPVGNPAQVAVDVAAFGTHVIAVGVGRLEIWDVSTPAVPAFESELTGGGWTGNSNRSLASDDTIAIATQSSGVVLIDYSNPNAPTVAGSITEQTSVADIGLRGDLLYVPVVNGVRVYDISNSDVPVLAGSYLEIEAYTLSLAFSDEHVYASTENGLRVLGDMPGFCEARCGNDTVEFPEECDDGNPDDGDGCSASCADE